MINKEYLPSRSVVAFVLMPLITVVVIWYLLSSAPTVDDRQEALTSFEQVVNESVSEYNDRDTDGDLLKDWEEFLYNTDINQVDTDGDGLDDYQEVLDPIRDPLVPDAEKGRYVATSTADNASSSVFYREDPNLNVTDVLARDLMVNFVQLQRSDAFDTPMQDTIIEKMAIETVKSDDRVPRIAIENLNIKENPTQADKIAYRQAYIDATEALNPASMYELELINYYAESEDPVFLQKLRVNADAYDAFAQVLAEATVPADIAPVHTELINNYGYMIDSVRLMATADTDPVGALIAADRYGKDEAAVDVSLQALAVYFALLR